MQNVIVEEVCSSKPLEQEINPIIKKEEKNGYQVRDIKYSSCLDALDGAWSSALIIFERVKND